MGLVRPEQITSWDLLTPQEIAHAAEVCDEVLEILAEDEADQALARGLIDERLNLLGSVATQPRDTDQPPTDRKTPADRLSAPTDIASRRQVHREGRKSLNVALIVCMVFSLAAWAMLTYAAIAMRHWL